MAQCIISRKGSKEIELTGNMTAGDLREGKTGYSADPEIKIVGTLADKGAWSSSVEPGGSVTIPAGYHNGSGKVTANAAGYPGLPSGYKYLTGTKTMEEVNAAATIFPMSATFSGGTFTPACAED